MLTIGIFGAPGSGKGTQGKLISEKYGLHSISIGEILRQEMANKTEIGLKAEEYICQGELLPDPFIIKVFSDVLHKTANRQGYIFDGYPRTLAQAKALDDLLMEQNASISAVFSLLVDEEELINRLLKRGELLRRGDDNLQTIRNRLLIYREQTEPVQDYYEKQGKLIKIFGKNSVEKIFENIQVKMDIFFRE